MVSFFQVDFNSWLRKLIKQKSIHAKILKKIN